MLVTKEISVSHIYSTSYISILFASFYNPFLLFYMCAINAHLMWIHVLSKVQRIWGTFTGWFSCLWRAWMQNCVQSKRSFAAKVTLVCPLYRDYQQWSLRTDSLALSFLWYLWIPPSQWSKLLKNNYIHVQSNENYQVHWFFSFMFDLLCSLHLGAQLEWRGYFCLKIVTIKLSFLRGWSRLHSLLGSAI